MEFLRRHGTQPRFFTSCASGRERARRAGGKGEGDGDERLAVPTLETEIPAVPRIRAASRRRECRSRVAARRLFHFSSFPSLFSPSSLSLSLSRSSRVSVTRDSTLDRSSRAMILYRRGMTPSRRRHQTLTLSDAMRPYDRRLFNTFFS